MGSEISNVKTRTDALAVHIHMMQNIPLIISAIKSKCNTDADEDLDMLLIRLNNFGAFDPQFESTIKDPQEVERYAEQIIKIMTDLLQIMQTKYLKDASMSNVVSVLRSYLIGAQKLKRSASNTQHQNKFVSGSTEKGAVIMDRVSQLEGLDGVTRIAKELEQYLRGVHDNRNADLTQVLEELSKANEFDYSISISKYIAKVNKIIDQAVNTLKAADAPGVRIHDFTINDWAIRQLQDRQRKLHTYSENVLKGKTIPSNILMKVSKTTNENTIAMVNVLNGMMPSITKNLLHTCIILKLKTSVVDDNNVPINKMIHKLNELVTLKFASDASLGKVIDYVDRVIEAAEQILDYVAQAKDKGDNSITAAEQQLYDCIGMANNLKQEALRECINNTPEQPRNKTTNSVPTPTVK